jgi:hypothetical protein
VPVNPATRNISATFPNRASANSKVKERMSLFEKRDAKTFVLQGLKLMHRSVMPAHAGIHGLNDQKHSKTRQTLARKFVMASQLSWLLRTGAERT